MTQDGASNSLSDYSEICEDIPKEASYLKILMGHYVDYFRPIPGKTYCDMLNANNLHEHSVDKALWYPFKIIATAYSPFGQTTSFLNSLNVRCFYFRGKY